METPGPTCAPRGGTQGDGVSLGRKDGAQSSVLACFLPPSGGMGPFGPSVNKQECIKGTPECCTRFWHTQSALQARGFWADGSDQKGFYHSGMSCSGALELTEKGSLQIPKQEL